MYRVSNDLENLENLEKSGKRVLPGKVMEKVWKKAKNPGKSWNFFKRFGSFQKCLKSMKSVRKLFKMVLS